VLGKRVNLPSGFGGTATFRILFRKYLAKPEEKSLAPDGTPRTGTTQGLLQRSKIAAGKLIPLSKETDRRWEHGEDPSVVDPKLQTYGVAGNLVVADEYEIKEWRKIGVRKLMRATKLTQKVIYSILSGKGVRQQTMKVFRIGLALIKSL
jgi:hypothetical protein